MAKSGYSATDADGTHETGLLACEIDVSNRGKGVILFLSNDDLSRDSNFDNMFLG